MKRLTVASLPAAAFGFAFLLSAGTPPAQPVPSGPVLHAAAPLPAMAATPKPPPPQRQAPARHRPAKRRPPRAAPPAATPTMPVVTATPPPPVATATPAPAATAAPAPPPPAKPKPQRNFDSSGAFDSNG